MEKGAHLLAADREHLFEGPAAEELGHADPLHELPVGAVRGEGEVGGAVGEVSDGGVDWTGGEGGFMGLEDFLCGVCRADDDCGDGAEAEVDEWAVAFGELV